MQRPKVCSNTLLFIITALAFALSACQGKPAENASRTSQRPTQTATSATPRPLLAGRIDNVSLYPVPNNASDLAISLVVSVTNAGEPTVAQNWKLEVNSPGGQEPIVVEPVYVAGVVDMPGGQGQKVDLAKEDLAIKAARTSITAKDRLTGILTFVLKETSESKLASNNTRLAVHFKDQQGNSYQSPQVALGAKPKNK
jgi:hypothetical protein